jgi:predicted pyridoxine 5'-phosphate oxidase superfamily flavin-nucleotide-binding protein
MPGSETAVDAYVAALIDPRDDQLDALADALSGGAVVVGPAGPGEGLDAIRSALAEPRLPSLLTGATASVRELEPRRATVDLQLAPGKAMSGLVLHITFDSAGSIERVEQEMITAPRAQTTPLMLTDNIKAAVAGAFDNGTPIVVAYVDADGVPHLSLRGSTQPFSDTQLAMWIRDPSGGLVTALPTNPHVALFYRDPATRASYQFSGRAHVESDAHVRDTVYANTAELERNLDARRLGVAVLVDLERVEGRGPGGPIRMERSPN